MKRAFSLISIISILSILLITVLYTFSNKINHQKNGFIRLFRPHLITPTKNLDIKYNSYYIAGTTKNYIYLGNYIVPTHLLVAKYDLADTESLELRVAHNVKANWPVVQVSIDSPNVYLVDGITPTILHSDLSTREVNEYLKRIPFFTSVQPISNSSFVIRAYDNHLQKSILAKVSVDSPYFKSAPDLLIKQVDGSFCTDGMLHYDPDLACIIYLYYYRNQFLCLDTNLNVIYRGNTIDTISHAQIKVSKINSNTSTFSAPPVIVNKKSCVAGDWLFVNSGLIANNETKEMFDKYSVIDIYSLKDGQYHFSFYVPLSEKEKITSLRVYNKTLIVIYDKFIRTFHVNF